MIRPEDLGKDGVLPGMDAQQQVKITPDMTTKVVCSNEDCGHNQFEQTILIRSVSPLLSPNGKKMVIPAQAYACKKCGHINPELDPFNEDG